MSRHASDTRQRKSRKYIDLHRQLREECKPEPSKQDRKRAASQSFRSRGE